MLAAFTSTHAALIAAALGALLGWLFAFLLRRQDHRTFLFARAPALPIEALSEHDDAWLRGEVRCQRPLRCPWFDVPCVAYDYSIEEERTEHYTDSNGKRRTRTTWETVHSEERRIGFELDDGALIAVALPEGKLEASTGLDTDYEHSDRRHSASVLHLGATVSAFGVVRDDGSFGPLRNVPLLVTFATRNERVRSAQRHETVLLVLSLLFAYAGAVTAIALLREAATWQDWIVPAAIGLAVLAPQWWLLTYNRLVRLRQQVRAAEKQVSIELAMRGDLVPNLVSVLQAASAHEQDLLRHVAELRSGGTLDEQVRGEEHARATAHAVLLLHERYPDLKSDALYRDLHQRLWAIEEKIAHARSFWNDTVTEWNDRVQQVPSSLVAGAARMTPRPLFAAGEEVELPPRLDLDPKPDQPR